MLRCIAARAFVIRFGALGGEELESVYLCPCLWVWVIFWEVWLYEAAVWLLYNRVEVAAVVKSGRGHSQHRPSRPRSRFMIWRIGMGRTAGSRFVVRKSQNIFGQKKPLIEAAIWSVRGFLVSRCSLGFWGKGRRTGCCGEDDQAGPVVLY